MRRDRGPARRSRRSGWRPRCPGSPRRRRAALAAHRPRWSACRPAPPRPAAARPRRGRRARAAVRRGGPGGARRRRAGRTGRCRAGHRSAASRVSHDRSRSNLSGRQQAAADDTGCVGRSDGKVTSSGARRRSPEGSRPLPSAEPVPGAREGPPIPRRHDAVQTGSCAGWGCRLALAAPVMFIDEISARTLGAGWARLKPIRLYLVSPVRRSGIVADPVERANPSAA